jgi:replicative DNA helicase
MTDLPHNLEAEKMVISAILQYPEIVPELVDMIEPGDFYNPKHGIIFQGVRDLVTRKEPVDLATIADTVDVQFPAVGSYLSEIADKAPTSQVQNHVRLVLEHSALRQAISLCQKSMSELYGCTGNASDVIDEIQTKFLQLGVRGTKQQYDTMRELMHQTIDRYKSLREGKERGIKTGFFLLDQATGGFRGSQFIVIAGRPGMGKSSLALNMADYCGQCAIPCGIFSLEMDKEEWNDRHITLKTGISTSRLNKDGGADASDWQSIMNAASVIAEYPIMLDDNGGLTVAEIKRRARLMVKNGARIIFIDQLSKIRGRGKDRFEKAANVVNELSTFPKEVRIPIVLLAQINREAERRGGQDVTRWTHKPAVSMLKDTGTLEEDADIVLLVYRPYVYTKAREDDGFANVEIAKHRGGPTLDIELKWDGRRMAFSNPD